MIDTFQIIYASTSGNTEAVCIKIADILNDKGIRTKLSKAEKTKFQTITDNTYFILATSTWEHGEINPYFNDLYQQISTNDMSHKEAAFIGLGDIRYEQFLFCKGMEVLRESFLNSNGIELLSPLKINGEPYKQMNTLVTTWGNNLINVLNQ